MPSVKPTVRPQRHTRREIDRSFCPPRKPFGRPTKVSSSWRPRPTGTRHDPLDPNDEGSTADQALPRTGSPPSAAHETSGRYRSTMTPPGIGATRAEVAGMVPSTVLKCWCPYTCLLYTSDAADE